METGEGQGCPSQLAAPISDKGVSPGPPPGKASPGQRSLGFVTSLSYNIGVTLIE